MILEKTVEFSQYQSIVCICNVISISTFAYTKINVSVLTENSRRPNRCARVCLDYVDNIVMPSQITAKE